MTKSGDSYVYDTTGAGGSVTLHPCPMLGNDTMYVTVTKRNYDPYEGYAIVSADCPSQPAPQKLFHCARVPDLRPTLTFSSTDPQGDAIAYRVMWDTTSAFTTPDSSTTPAYASGAAASFVFPSDLAGGRLYFWKVKGRDPSGSNKWGPYSAARAFTVETTMPVNSCSWFQGRAVQFGEDVRSGLQLSGDTVRLATTQVTDTLVYEDFESDNGGFSMTSGNSNTSDDWKWSTGVLGYSSGGPAGTRWWRCYTDSNSGTNDETLLTPAFDCSAGQNLTLTWFGAHRMYNASAYYDLEYSVNGGSSWTRINRWTTSSNSYPSAQYGDFDLSDLEGAGNCRLRWHLYDVYGYGAGVDNVLITGTHDALVGSGTITTLPTCYADLNATYARSNWGYVHCRKRAAADSVGVRVQYQDGGVWALIPDNRLSGNSAGFHSAQEFVTVDLSGLNTGTYDTIRLVVTITRDAGKASADPGLLSVETGATNANPLAVTMSSFTAAAGPDGVRLLWRTESESDCYRWEVERSPRDGAAYAVIGTVAGHGTTAQPTDYAYTDADWLEDGTYYYRLVEIDMAGWRSVFGPLEVMVGGRAAPLVYELGRCRPNPSGGEPVTILFALKQPGAASLLIYNALGQVVRTLAAGDLPAGRHARTWDGRDDRGRAVAGGVYLYRLTAGPFTATRKMTVIK
ncbi:MAG: hypothetical protein MUF78_03440 [Candidatus Edwardsbacteria bacterium]|nr:hypothetical protein [Candidatus Edwardsbacteria bacterium]